MTEIACVQVGGWVGEPVGGWVGWSETELVTIVRDDLPSGGVIADLLGPTPDEALKV